MITSMEDAADTKADVDIQQTQQPAPFSSSDKKSFGRDVGKLASGTIIAQVIGLLAYPIITRLYGTETYGTFSVFLSIVSILTTIVCLRYEQAILLPENDRNGGAVFLACIAIAFVFSLIIPPIVLIFGEQISNLFNAPGLSMWLAFVPLVVLIDGLYMALRFWNTRRRRFGTQASTQALQTFSGSVLKVGFGGFGWLSAGALIVAQILGQGIGLFILGLQALRYDFAILRQSLSLKNIKKQIVRYQKFPKIDMWSMLMHNISWQLPVLMLTSFFSASVAGLYAIGHTVIQTPLSLIGGSIGQVYFQWASKARLDGTIGKFTEDIVELMMFLSLVPLMVLMVMGGDLFALVFGSEWFEGGVYVQILAVWAVLWFISYPIGNATSVLEIQECRFRYTVANLITRFLALFIGGYFQNVYLAMMLFALFGIMTYGYLFYAIFKHSKASFRKVLYDTRKTLAFCAGYVVVAALLLYVLQVNFFVVLGLTVVSAAGYYLVLLKTNKKVKEYFPF